MQLIGKALVMPYGRVHLESFPNRCLNIDIPKAVPIGEFVRPKKEVLVSTGLTPRLRCRQLRKIASFQGTERPCSGLIQSQEARSGFFCLDEE